MRTLTFIIVLYLFGTLVSCEKEPNFQNAGKDVEIYLIDKYKVIEGTAQIIDSTVKLKDKALINYDQILSYNQSTHIFEISESAIDTINQDGGLKCHFKAFAVTVDKNIIYTGYFWPSYASSIKQWFVIDPILNTESKGLKVQLAYPTDNFSGIYPDKRNDPRMINVFRRDGKI